MQPIEIWQSASGEWHVRVYDVVWDFQSEELAREFLEFQK